MQKPDSHTIQEATRRAKQRLSIELLRGKAKYRDITEQEYDKLFEHAEAFSLLILESHAKDEVIGEE